MPQYVAAKHRFAWLVLVGLCGCTESNPERQEGAMTIAIASPAFAPNGSIPSRYTCEGADLSPELSWTGVPASARSLAIVIDDPDAPDPRRPAKTAWVHWVLYNLPASVTGIPEGAGTLPPGTRQGRNSWKRTGYGGPCPPVGRHRYFHRLFALDTVLEDLGTPTGAELERAMQGHVLAQGELVGTYEKSRR